MAGREPRTGDTEDLEHGEAAELDDDSALIAEIDAELMADDHARRRAPDRLTGAVLLIGGVIGWLAALTLLVDKLRLLEDPDATLLCDINPFISCGGVMMSWQAEALGVPNMAIGLGGFAIMGAAGSLLLARAPLPRWFRAAVLGGMTFAFGFVHFLAISAIFVIHALCPWCLIVWTVTAPMLFATLAHAVEAGTLRVPRGLGTVLRHWVVLTVAWYALVVVVILAAFWPQWLAMAGV